MSDSAANDRGDASAASGERTSSGDATTPVPDAPPGRTSFLRGLRAVLSSTRNWLAAAAVVLILLGFAWITLYAFATDGPHQQFLAVGLLTAFACFVVGYLFGFLFGIPRIVSSGALRQTAATAGKTENARSLAARASYIPSSNLAEVSDWLTKLLLGAGLVNLTNLGPPLGGLITHIGSGLQRTTPDTSSSAAGPVMAGAIIFTYVTLGFLIGYILTTTWYQRLLQKLIDRAPAS